MSAGTATDPDPATTLRRLALALHASRALHAAAVLDLAGLLADRPRDSASLGVRRRSPTLTARTCTLMRTLVTPADRRSQGSVRPLVPSPFVACTAAR